MKMKQEWDAHSKCDDEDPPLRTHIYHWRIQEGPSLPWPPAVFTKINYKQEDAIDARRIYFMYLHRRVRSVCPHD